MSEGRTTRTISTTRKKRCVRKDPLVGSTVKSVRSMTKAEVLDQGWGIPPPNCLWPTCVEFSDGTILTASQDPADTQDYRPGTLVGVDGDGDHFQFRSSEELRPRPAYTDKKPYPLPAAQIKGRNGRVVRKVHGSDDINDN